MNEFLNDINSTLKCVKICINTNDGVEIIDIEYQWVEAIHTVDIEKGIFAVVNTNGGVSLYYNVYEADFR